MLAYMNKLRTVTKNVISALMSRPAALSAVVCMVCAIGLAPGCSKKTGSDTVEAAAQTSSTPAATATESANQVGENTGEGANNKPTQSNQAAATNTAKNALAGEKTTYAPIDWTDLLPDADLTALENPPEYLTEIEDGSEDDRLASQLKAQSDSAADDPYQQALVSKNIRPEFNGRAIRIAGFIVPLEFDDNETITTFFFVPFFGACIHMPPPPPNQIIYAQYEPGIRLEALYDPFWISGTLSTILIENDLATAAYSMNVTAIEPYSE